MHNVVSQVKSIQRLYLWLNMQLLPAPSPPPSHRTATLSMNIFPTLLLCLRANGEAIKCCRCAAIALLFDPIWHYFYRLLAAAALVVCLCVFVCVCVTRWMCIKVLQFDITTNKKQPKQPVDINVHRSCRRDVRRWHCCWLAVAGISVVWIFVAVLLAACSRRLDALPVRWKHKNDKSNLHAKLVFG